MKNSMLRFFMLIVIFSSLVTGKASAQSATPATVVIGTQVWDTKNLTVTAFANGDKIEQAQTSEEWIKAGNEGRPVWCYYENDTDKGQTYGILYNWFAVGDPRGLAPKGWHVPSKEEWLTMLDQLGGKGVAGLKLKSKTGWEAVSGVDRNGDGSTVFNAMPGGLRFAEDGKFDARGTRCQFWTSTKNTSVNAAIIVVGISNAVTPGIASNKFGYSVRCIKD